MTKLVTVETIFYIRL